MRTQSPYWKGFRDMINKAIHENCYPYENVLIENSEVLEKLLKEREFILIEVIFYLEGEIIEEFKIDISRAELRKVKDRESYLANQEEGIREALQIRMIEGDKFFVPYYLGELDAINFLRAIEFPILDIVHYCDLYDRFGYIEIRFIALRDGKAINLKGHYRVSIEDYTKERI